MTYIPLICAHCGNSISEDYEIALRLSEENRTALFSSDAVSAAVTFYGTTGRHIQSIRPQFIGALKEAKKKSYNLKFCTPNTFSPYTCFVILHYILAFMFSYFV